MELATWILVIILSAVLLIFLILGIILVIKLIKVADDAKGIVATGQQIATKADDIVDNVKGLTSVGGIVRNFSNHVIAEQNRNYAEAEAARVAKQSAKQSAKAEKKAAKPKK